MNVVDLEILLCGAKIPGSPPDLVRQLGIAGLSVKYMKSEGIRLGQPLWIRKVDESDRDISSSLERLRIEDVCSTSDLRERDIFASDRILVMAWPLMVLSDDCVALDAWSCRLLFSDAFRRQCIVEYTADVVSNLKRELDSPFRKRLSPAMSLKKNRGSTEKKKEESIERRRHVVQLWITPCDESSCRVADTVVLKVLGWGPPQVNGMFVPMDECVLEGLESNLTLQSYLKHFLLNRYLCEHVLMGVSWEGKELYFRCEQIGICREKDIGRKNETDINDSLQKNRMVDYSPTVWKTSTTTRIKMNTGLKQMKSASDNLLSTLGGLDSCIETIQAFLTSCFSSDYLEQLSRLGISPSRGILLYGAPGTGKSTLAKAIAESLNDVHVQVIKGPSMISENFGETEASLIQIFEQVGSRVPSILIIDEMDGLGVKRDNVFAIEAECRLTTTLLSCMDRMPNQLVIIGTTNRPDTLDPALRRAGRLDREIEVPVPTSRDRFAILRKMIERLHSNETSQRPGKEEGNAPQWQVVVSDKELEAITNELHGYVGADLMALWRESCHGAYRRWKNGHMERPIYITKEDLEVSRSRILPSAMREIVVQVPQVYWKDIGGYHTVKQQLQEAVEWPMKYGRWFRRFGISPLKGILLYGPPGCSKTLMAKALATESSFNFLSVKGPELFQKWVGESEKAVRSLFRKAKAVAPCIIFFDEIDALAPRRQLESSEGHTSGGSAEQRVLAQLLTEMDGIGSSSLTSSSDSLNQVEPWILVMGATNRPDLLDPALLRPGRFDRLIYVGLPDAEAREQILRIHCASIPVNKYSIDWKRMAEQDTEGMTGAEIAALCREASMCALQQVMEKDCREYPPMDSSYLIDQEHFHQALKALKPRTNPQLLSFYESFLKTSGYHHIVQ